MSKDNCTSIKRLLLQRTFYSSYFNGVTLIVANCYSLYHMSLVDEVSFRLTHHKFLVQGQLIACSSYLRRIPTVTAT